MDGKITCSTTLILLLFITHSLYQGSNATRSKQPKQAQNPYPKEKQLKASTSQKDITTPITTVPTIIPIPTTMPIVNPESISPAVTTPNMNPTSTVGSGGSWCIASQSGSEVALQMGLDYACGIGGAECGEIQMGGSCYNPNSVREHASYAFNRYYQKNPLPNSCNFGGTAVITSTNPSTGTCQYPSTSTSSSILNITNSSGSTVFGAVPTHPSTSSSPNSNLFSLTSFRSLLIFTTLLFIARPFFPLTCSPV